MDKVSLIGGAGFIGSRLARRFDRQERQYTIYDIDISNSNSNFKELDVEDSPSLDMLLGSDVIINLAAVRRILVRRVYGILSKFVYGHKNKCVIVQNMDDELNVVSLPCVTDKEVSLIPGSGVNLSDYRNTSICNKENIVVLPARLLVDKGVTEFCMAAKLLHMKGHEWYFVLAGTADYKNPSAISKEIIASWVQEGHVKWLGHIDDMPALMAKASIVCLPSYREGVPKVLLEAAAA